MAVKLLSSSGGSVTLDVPVTSSNFALTLPAANGTVITTGSTGQVIPKAALPTGSVLQVVSATTTTQTSINSSSYTDTGLSVSITPTSSSSKILVLIYQPYRYTSAAVGGGIQIYRNSTNLTIANSDGVGPYQLYSPVGQDVYAVFAASFLDSPATTSSTTYKTQARPYNTAGSIVLQLNGPNTNSMSTITLMEIAA
jgi:hypothetical protein